MHNTTPVRALNQLSSAAPRWDPHTDPTPSTQRGSGSGVAQTPGVLGGLRGRIWVNKAAGGVIRVSQIRRLCRDPAPVALTSTAPGDLLTEPHF